MPTVPDGYALRPFRRSDLIKIARIERAVFPGDAWSVSDFVYLLREIRSAALVAEARSEVVGYMVGQAIDDEGYIVTIAVRPDHQGKDWVGHYSFRW
jgi:ribosomal protein S18 acetylase RimI-like enzyme